jgi:endogenous inhibitor of DNA gyrase (YacG/DUF329 family)
MFSRMADDSICPTCKRRSATYHQNPAHPFCGRQCKLADLSNWFNERYGVAAEPVGDPDDDEGPRMLN